MASVPPLYSPVTSAEPSPIVCPACNHRNPPAAKFCNECGLPVHLRECWHCEAVNDRAASVCYKCGITLSIGGYPAPQSDQQPEAPPAQDGIPQPDAPLPQESALERDTVSPEFVLPGDLPGLKECPECDAVNDPSATLCHQCQSALVDMVADPSAPDVQPAPAQPRISNVERAAAAIDTPAAVPETFGATEPPLHYVGVLTARADEAELDQADVVAHHHARRAHRLRLAAAALVVMPSMVAGTLYALEHREIVDRAVDYARAAIVTPVVRAASSAMDLQSSAETEAAKTSVDVPAQAVRAPSSAAGVAVPGTTAEPASAPDDRDAPAPQSAAPASTELVTSTQESAPTTSR